jgi:hypothetical protein
MYAQSPQYSVAIVGDDGAVPTNGANATIISTDLITAYDGSAAGTSAVIEMKGKLQNFDSRPGFGVSYTSASFSGAIFRKGFYVAFRNTNNRARRGPENTQ